MPPNNTQTAPNTSDDGAAENTEDSSSDESSIAYYECPHCGHSDSSELRVRQHVTDSDDSKHRGRHGFSPSENVIAIDANGDHVDILSGGIEPISSVPPGELTSDLIPDDIGKTDLDRTIFEKALFNPTATIKELHESLQADGVEVSYAKVREVVKSTPGTAHRPDGRTQRGKRKTQANTDTQETNDDEDVRDVFDDWTEKQTAVIKAYTVMPWGSFSSIANLADVSSAYVDSVLRREYDGERVAVDEFNAPSVEESRLMAAANIVHERGGDVTDRDELAGTNVSLTDGAFVDTESEDYGLASLTFHQRAILDYAHENPDHPPAKIGDALHYPEGYVEYVLATHGSLNDPDPESDEGDEGDERVTVRRGNASYTGKASGVDDTYTYIGDVQRRHAHRRRLKDLERLPELDEFDTGPDPEEVAERNAEFIAEHSDEQGVVVEDVGTFLDLDDTDPETAEQRESRATDADDDGVGVAPDPSVPAPTVNRTELVAFIESDMEAASRGAERGIEYAAGQYDALQRLRDFLANEPGTESEGSE